MSLFFNYTLNGVASGMIYALLALALVLDLPGHPDHQFRTRARRG